MPAPPPAPLPFCSVRIQYSGPAGSLQAQVSSIESKGNLVVDSHVQNEGNGWAGSGANPWHLDDDTESILFLTSESDKTAGIGFSVTANNVHYYLTDLRLNPHETRVIDLRKLRDAQQPDFKKNVIPATATDGSVSWIRVDNVPVMGRLMVINRRQGMASNYDCCTCPCCADYDLEALVFSPLSAIVPVGGQTSFAATATTENCNGSYKYINVTRVASWLSSNTSMATVASGGIVTGQRGGTATISADFDGCLDWETNMDNECECESSGSPGPGSGPVYVVSITGQQTVWWFNGQTPSAYATTITLTAQPSGMSSYSWSLLAGTDKATLGGQSANTINLTGNGWSTGQGDVTVQVDVTTPAGNKFATYNVTVRGPYKLVPGYPPGGVPAYQDTANGSGYLTYATYTILDNFSTLLQYSVPLNESWTTGVVYDYSASNWPQATAGGYTTSSATPAAFADHIGAQGQGLVPLPTNPQSPLSSVAVYHWGQEWCIGSTTPNLELGVPVQTDTLQYYVDHGRHLSIVSPAP